MKPEDLELRLKQIESTQARPRLAVVVVHGVSDPLRREPVSGVASLVSSEWSEANLELALQPSVRLRPEDTTKSYPSVFAREDVRRGSVARVTEDCAGSIVQPGSRSPKRISTPRLEGKVDNARVDFFELLWSDLSKGSSNGLLALWQLLVTVLSISVLGKDIHNRTTASETQVERPGVVERWAGLALAGTSNLHTILLPSFVAAHVFAVTLATMSLAQFAFPDTTRAMFAGLAGIMSMGLAGFLTYVRLGQNPVWPLIVGVVGVYLGYQYQVPAASLAVLALAGITFWGLGKLSDAIGPKTHPARLDAVWSVVSRVFLVGLLMIPLYNYLRGGGLVTALLGVEWSIILLWAVLALSAFLSGIFVLFTLPELLAIGWLHFLGQRDKLAKRRFHRCVGLASIWLQWPAILLFLCLYWAAWSGILSLVPSSKPVLEQNYRPMLASQIDMGQHPFKGFPFRVQLNTKEKEFFRLPEDGVFYLETDCSDDRWAHDDRKKGTWILDGNLAQYKRLYEPDEHGRAILAASIYLRALLVNTTTVLFLPVLFVSGTAFLLALVTIVPSALAEARPPRRPSTIAEASRRGSWLSTGQRANEFLTGIFGVLLPLVLGIWMVLAFIYWFSGERPFGEWWTYHATQPLRSLSEKAIAAVGALAFGYLIAPDRIQALGQILFPVADRVDDVIQHIRKGPQDVRGDISARYRQLLRHIEEHYDGLVIVAHSQGSVITADLLRWVHPFKDGFRVHLLTMGCPLGQLYRAYIADLYDWVTEVKPRELGVEKWRNLYCSGDYVGRWLWRTQDYYAAAGTTSVGGCEEVCLGDGAHTHYWDPESEAGRQVGVFLKESLRELMK